MPALQRLLNSSLFVVAGTLCLLCGSVASGATASLANTPAAASQGVPRALVGRWTSIGGGNAQWVFALASTGAYEHAGLLTYEGPTGGTVEFLVHTRGRATTQGRTLVLRQRSGTMSRHDPASPNEDYERQLGPAIQRYRWSVSGGILRLTRNGSTIAYRR